MIEPYKAKFLPQACNNLDFGYFMDDLIDASAAMEVYVTKMNDSRLEYNWFFPTIQKNEAVKSLLLEGTQCTLDGLLLQEIDSHDADKDLLEVINYMNASVIGYKSLSRGKDFSDQLLFDIHSELLSGNVRKVTGLAGQYRTGQNYIGKYNTNEITYTPPVPDDVPALMKNLIAYINDDKNKVRPLVKAAVIHAQFETIHPFYDGNGRVGRILIPLFLYAKNVIPMPFFFISESLEHDKHKYYSLLMGIREKGNWNEWVRFFLQIVNKQCRKYSAMIDEINVLYEATKNKACDLIKSSSGIIKIVDMMFKSPVLDTKSVHENTGIPPATINRYLNTLVENGILFTDGKQRNKHFFFYDLLSIIRS